MVLEQEGLTCALNVSFVFPEFGGADGIAD